VRAQLRIIVLSICLMVMLVSCKSNNIIQESSESQIRPPEASIEQIPEAPVKQIPVTKDTPEDKSDLLFSSENYTERQDLKGLTLTNIEQEITRKEYLQYLQNPISYDSEKWGAGDLIIGKKIIRYDLDFGGGLGYDAVSDYISYYELPEVFSDNLSLTLIDFERSILLDRSNGLFIVCADDNKIMTEIKTKQFIHAIQFKDKLRMDGINEIGGYKDSENERIAIVTTKDNTIYFVNTDTLKVMEVRESKWRTLSNFQRVEEYYLWQVDMDNTRIRLVDLFTNEVQDEFVLSEIAIEGEVIQVCGNQYMVYVAVKQEDKHLIYRYGKNLNETDYSERFENYPETNEDDKFGTIIDMWVFNGNSQRSYIAVFQKDQIYPIRLLEFYSDKWINRGVSNE
jgi:hypothetical protein